ncbi:MAG: hypothetical protein HZA94_01260 [Candidatus Vogelbacteria bacterium]|nr:hypothetical protein [Candidatus Vogelbacteria bacterium]
MIKQQTRVTTNIDTQLLKFVDQMAKKREATRREIIEESIDRLRLDTNRQSIIDDYNELADNEKLMGEWLAIANNPDNLKW